MTSYSEIRSLVANNMATIIVSDSAEKNINLSYVLSKTFGRVYCSRANNLVTLSAHYYCKRLQMINHDSISDVIYSTHEYLYYKMVETIASCNFTTKPDEITWFCSVLILDGYELHKIEIDLIICLWMWYYEKWLSNSFLPAPPKLIITTSILDDSILFMLPPKPVTNIISIRQSMDNQTELIFDPESDSLMPNTEDRYVRASYLAQQYHIKKYPGNYLIFVPGKLELDIVQSHLLKYFNVDEIIIFHDGLATEKLYAKIKLIDTHKNKIVVSCENMESFVPQKNFKLLIDTMTCKPSIYQYNETMIPSVKFIGKFKSGQRRKMINQGIYLIMMSEEKYLSLPETISCQDPVIYDKICHLKNYHLEPTQVFKNLLSIINIKTQWNLLQKLNLVDPRISITNSAYYFCMSLPLPLRKAAMIYHLVETKNSHILFYLVTICTLCCYGQGIFSWPKKINAEDHLYYSMRLDDTLTELEHNFAGYSDVDTIFNIWIKIFQEINPFYITNLKAFCKKYHLRFQKFKEVIFLLKDCLTIASHKKINLDIPKNIGKMTFPDPVELSYTFYHLLSITHQDYEASVVYNHQGCVAIMNDQEYRIDNRSVHLMDVGNCMYQIYYALVLSEKQVKKETIKIIHVLHTIPPDNDEDSFSIFHSDAHSDDELSDLEWPPEYVESICDPELPPET